MPGGHCSSRLVPFRTGEAVGLGPTRLTSDRVQASALSPHPAAVLAAGCGNEGAERETGRRLCKRIGESWLQVHRRTHALFL
jgi:hypothetical protein